MSLMDHATNELRIAGYFDGDEVNKAMADAVLKLVKLFAGEGHSGMSAPFCIGLFKTLASYEPLTPLTGADDEWNKVGKGVYQNKRCSHVFQDASRFDGQAYDIDAIIFKEPDGACFTDSRSAKPITFPYTPDRTYVKVPARKQDRSAESEEGK